MDGGDIASLLSAIFAGGALVVASWAAWLSLRSARAAESSASASEASAQATETQANITVRSFAAEHAPKFDFTFATRDGRCRRDWQIRVEYLAGPSMLYVRPKFFSIASPGDNGKKRERYDEQRNDWRLIQLGETFPIFQPDGWPLSSTAIIAEVSIESTDDPGDERVRWRSGRRFLWHEHLDGAHETAPFEV
ncbi:hypothetical protein [Actinomycetospora chibensis]|uniref:Uncharacterized protein n=1 Tax=Actinomycetospora chibensis TaxID=663606 RepID=A0ABV9RN07_9PSEU|nr:hypothetical protein [Actinomycetospora chibensis]MDD7926951.1 hypothetical protein [Actinomycetospora chibensis]